MNGLVALIRRELALSWGRGGGPLLALAFYLSLATLLPLAAGSEPERLKAVAIGSTWMALAVASLLSLERLFDRDYEDGALDLLLMYWFVPFFTWMIMIFRVRSIAEHSAIEGHANA